MIDACTIKPGIHRQQTPIHPLIDGSEILRNKNQKEKIKIIVDIQEMKECMLMKCIFTRVARVCRDREDAWAKASSSTYTALSSRFFCRESKDWTVSVTLTKAACHRSGAPGPFSVPLVIVTPTSPYISWTGHVYDLLHFTCNPIFVSEAELT